ncbi:hypothetical protein QTO34_017056 [Cnephaeus nilssonii]|uniref:Rec21/ENK19 domain-containing protein n=1 Tax=Cnephaeus nilssonii TaxID=3371016 RepID=A0AA40LNR2_CNENI|nr:hypothetical protein QTO34_017056 [Eptesicus nilssonii]
MPAMLPPHRLPGRWTGTLWAVSGAARRASSALDEPYPRKQAMVLPALPLIPKKLTQDHLADSDSVLGSSKGPIELRRLPAASGEFGGDQRLFKDKEQLRPFEDEKSPTTEADSYPKTTSTRPKEQHSQFGCQNIMCITTMDPEKLFVPSFKRLRVALMTAMWKKKQTKATQGAEVPTWGQLKKLTTEAQQMVEKQEVEATPSTMFLAVLALTPQAHTFPRTSATGHCDHMSSRHVSSLLLFKEHQPCKQPTPELRAAASHVLPLSKEQQLCELPAPSSKE